MITSKLHKVIGTGLISIPAFWQHLNKIKKGDEIKVVITDNALIILKHDEKEKEHLEKLGITLEDD